MSDQTEEKKIDFKSFIFNTILNRVRLLLWVVVIFGSLAGLAVSYFWYENVRQSLSMQSNVLCEKTVQFQSDNIENRLSAIEKGLLDIRSTLADDFDKGRRREEQGLVRQGNVWYRPGSESESEILILAEATNALGRGAVSLSSYFDNLSRQLLHTDPAIDGVVYYSLSGVIRRLPGNGFTNRLGKDERWRGLKLVQESRLSKGVAVRWIEGAELSQISDGPAQTVLTTIDYENAISTILACELDCSELIPYRTAIDNGWIALFDRSTRLIAADSTAKQSLGAVRAPIIDHRDPNISMLGKRIQRSESGNGVLTLKGIPHHYAYKRIPETGWVVVASLPEITTNQKSEIVSRIIISSLIVPVIMLLITIILLVNYKKHLLKLSEEGAIAIRELSENVEKIGSEASLPKVKKDKFEEWEILTESIRACAKRTKAADPELPVKLRQFENLLRNLQTSIVIFDSSYVVKHFNTSARRLYPSVSIDRQAAWIAHERDKRAIINKTKATGYMQFDADSPVVDESGNQFYPVYVPLADEKNSGNLVAELLLPEEINYAFTKKSTTVKRKNVEYKKEENKPETKVIDSVEELVEPDENNKQNKIIQETQVEEPEAKHGMLYGINVPDPDKVIKKSAIGVEEKKEDKPGGMNLGGMLSLDQNKKSGRIERNEINLQEYALSEEKAKEEEIGPFGLVVTVREVMDASQQKYSDNQVSFYLDNPQGNFAMTSNKKKVKELLQKIIDYSVQKVEIGKIEVSLRSTLDYVSFGIIFDAPMFNEKEVQRILEAEETGEIVSTSSNIERASVLTKELNGILGVASRLNREIMIKIKLPRNAEE